MIVRENISLCNNRKFIKILYEYPHPSKTGLLVTLYCTMTNPPIEDGPDPIVDKEKHVSDDEVVE
jgi:hypothetical protein